MQLMIRKEVADWDNVLESNLSVWKRDEAKIVESKRGSRYATSHISTKCRWPALEGRI